MNLQAETTKPRRTWDITSADDRRGNHEEMAQTTEVGKRDPAEVEIKETRGGPRAGTAISLAALCVDSQTDSQRSGYEHSCSGSQSTLEPHPTPSCRHCAIYAI